MDKQARIATDYYIRRAVFSQYELQNSITVIVYWSSFYVWITGSIVADSDLHWY